VKSNGFRPGGLGGGRKWKPKNENRQMRKIIRRAGFREWKGCGLKRKAVKLLVGGEGEKKNWEGGKNKFPSRRWEREGLWRAKTLVLKKPNTRKRATEGGGGQHLKIRHWGTK